jgi:hypothetical protein
MIIQPNGIIRCLTVEEHLQRKPIVYQDNDYTIRLTSNKNQPFFIAEGQGEDIYIDLFALHFGKKEQLKRKTGKGIVPMRYGCHRCERDRILYLPVEEVVDERSRHHCTEECQYYSRPVGVKGRYAINCILVRYRAIGFIDVKSGLTLEEVGRIYGCTRERIRQIEEQAMRKMRHHTRSNRLKVFRERTPDYRDYYISEFEKIA